MNWMYALILVAGTLISSVSQVMLKKAAMKEYNSSLREYLNPLVIGAYALFVLSTLMSIWAYRGLPLSMGPLLETSGYLFVTAFGVLLFQEKLNRRKILALALIIGGIILSSL
ncbi:MAG: multidrug ABC transporter [Clostridia bacterium]|nr:multidrug ABC transporter [Clostridia bacterium]